MKVSLDQTLCIGCGLCVQVSPANFALEKEAGPAKVIQEETDDETVKEAEASCPVGCIRVQ